MGDAGFYRGTALEQDGRFTDKERKLLKQMKFEDVLDTKVDLAKVNLEVVKPWIAKRVTEILGVEDDVVVEYVNTQLEDKKLNPKINITGFLNARRAREFMGELWALLVEGSKTVDGIPQSLIDAKLEEMKLREPKGANGSGPVDQSNESDWEHRYRSITGGREFKPVVSPAGSPSRRRSPRPPRSPRRDRDRDGGRDRESRGEKDGARERSKTPPRRRAYDERLEANNPIGGDRGGRRRSPPPRRSPPRRSSPSKRSPVRRSSPPARRSSPPARRTSPPARKSSPPARRSSPPARKSSPPARRSSPPARRPSPPGAYANRRSPVRRRSRSPSRRRSASREKRRDPDRDRRRSRSPPVRRRFTEASPVKKNESDDEDEKAKKKKKKRHHRSDSEEDEEARAARKKAKKEKKEKKRERRDSD